MGKNKANKDEGITEKKIKAALKEGGKKGQDIVGLSEMGGVSFFHVSLESCEGEFELLDKALEGFNKPVDETAEDRKGGAMNLGKMLFSYNDDRLIFLCHCPEAVADRVDIKEWFGIVMEETKGVQVESGDERILKGEMKADPDNNIFPIKMRDNAISKGYQWLTEKKLVIADDSDDDVAYGDDDFPEYY